MAITAVGFYAVLAWDFMDALDYYAVDLVTNQTYKTKLAKYGN